MTRIYYIYVCIDRYIYASEPARSCMHLLDIYFLGVTNGQGGLFGDIIPIYIYIYIHICIFAYYT
jgi:hypothetical protein